MENIVRETDTEVFLVYFFFGGIFLKGLSELSGHMTDHMMDVPRDQVESGGKSHDLGGFECLQLCVT